MNAEQIINEIKSLSADTVVATNSGTYGAAECGRITGSGDSQHGDWTTYERLDGSRYTVGCDPTNAPGRARRLSPPSAAERRAKVEALKAMLEKSQTAAQQEQSHRDALARGWDGYQFVGIEEGQRRLAAK